MKKVIVIDGMKCGHCVARVEKALNSINGVEAKVNLEKNIATVVLDIEINDKILKNAVDDAGYKVVSIAEANE